MMETSAAARPHAAPAPAGAGFLRRAEPADALLFLYLVAFARQYLWVGGGGAAAWGLTIALAALACCLYVATRPFEPEAVGRQFWLVVALPLVFVYAMRAPFPDTSFDVLNYRLFHGERSLGWPLYAPGDFFPTPAPYNPAPDTLTAVARILLGYRLGTVVNLFAVLWAAQVADRILRPYVRRAWPRAAGVLLVVLAEHLLFEINSYMADLLALPLLLEATRLVLRLDEAAARGRTVRALAHVAFLCGASVAFKLTNAVVVVPLVVACVYGALWGRARLSPREWAAASGLTVAAFAAPLLPFTVYLYGLTGSPVFPVFNGLFRSPYWPANSGWDSRWGPVGWWEKLAWPVLAFFEPARHSELAVYSGRLSLGFLAALAGLFAARRDAGLRALCLLTLSGCLMWSAGGMGYSRYGLYPELLSGLVVSALASVLLRKASPRAPSPQALAASLLLLAALVAQAALACVYVSRYEWGMRPTVFTNRRAYFAEARSLLRDRSLEKFLAPGQAALFGGVEVWVESGMKTSGFEVMLNGGAPVIGVRHQEFFAAPAARAEYARAIDAAAGRRIFSLCYPEELPAARAVIESRGLRVRGVRPVAVPFFTRLAPTTLMLVEVARRPFEQGAAAAADARRGAPLPDDAYRAQISATSPPASLKAGAKATLDFRVVNRGAAAWPARGRDDGMFQVNLGNRWLGAGASRVVNDMDGRTALRADLAPGAEAALPLNVTAPARPGDYVLEIDLVHEGVTWFHERGSETLKLRVRVEP